MANNKEIRVALTAVLLLLFGAVVYLGYQTLQPPQYGSLGEDEIINAAPPPREPLTSPRTDGEIERDSGDVIAGGVERPASDLATSRSDTSDAEQSTSGADDPFDFGRTPGVALDSNEQTRAVAEAVRTGAYPERLTVSVGSKTARAFEPEKFDQESDAFDQDYRDAYLRSPEPGRVWFPAQPGDGVPRIQPLMPQYVQVDQGEEVTLRVSGVPGQPVTFTSFDLGMFENKLTTMTVVADDQGVAEAKFHGPPGTADDVAILAASPVMSGQVRLRVHVNHPGLTAAASSDAAVPTTGRID